MVVTRSCDRRGRAVYDHITFAQLETLSNRYANGLRSLGLSRGMRVLLMVRPGFEFVGLSFALFKMGVVPVMIDPGMGMRRLLECVRGVDLHGFIGIPLAHVLRVLRPRSFRNLEHIVTVGRRWGWGGASLAALARRGRPHFKPVPTRRDETAAILFTSGSTGPAKGVVYEHGVFGAQVEAIQQHYGIEPGEVDLPVFPLFALFSAAMGMTSVIADMDPSHPARVDPVKIVAAVSDQKITTTFGSPAVWNPVATHCMEQGVTLGSMRRVLIAGAPVPYHVIEKLHRVLPPGGEVYTPYGATESLPVASIGGREVLSGCSDRTRRGAGFCVGKPVPGTDLRLIRIADEAIPAWSDELEVGDGEIGEIVVSGEVVTKEYFGLEKATAMSKIRDGERIWHRIGDVGYLDKEGRIWFCGRKAHRVTTSHGVLFSVRCEAIFNEHGDVARSALVGIGEPGNTSAVIVIEPERGRFPRGSRVGGLRAELLALGAGNELTRDIRHVLFHPSLPVDVRHNAKINREALAAWAVRRIR